MNFKKIASKIICVISSSIAISTLAVTNAYAGPAIGFRYDYFNFKTSECIEAGGKVLVDNGLLKPENLVLLKNTPFASGESAEITAIIDCSQVGKTSRVTIMVTHTDNINTALTWTGVLLNSFVLEYGYSRLDEN